MPGETTRVSDRAEADVAVDSPAGMAEAQAAEPVQPAAEGVACGPGEEALTPIQERRLAMHAARVDAAGQIYAAVARAGQSLFERFGKDPSYDNHLRCLGARELDEAVSAEHRKILNASIAYFAECGFPRASQQAGHQAKAAEVQRGTAVDLGLEGQGGGLK